MRQVQQMPEQQTATTNELSWKYGLPSEFFRKLARDGKVTSYRLGRRLLIEVADVERLLNENRLPAA